MMCKVRLEEYETWNWCWAKQGQTFFEKIWKEGPKMYCLALKLYTRPPNCITGAYKSGVRGPGPQGSLDLLVVVPLWILTELHSLHSGEFPLHGNTVKSCGKVQKQVQNSPNFTHKSQSETSATIGLQDLFILHLMVFHFEHKICENMSFLLNEAK